MPISLRHFAWDWGANMLHIYSFGTDRNRAAHMLQSAAKNGLGVTYEGDGMEWKGWGQRMEAFHTFTERVKDSDIVMCVDAYDILFVADRMTLVHTFRDIGKPIVISAEKGCWPDENVASFHPNQDALFAYPNGGAYMGYAADIRRMLDFFATFEGYNCCDFEGNFYNSTDDQRCLTTYYLMNPQICALDHDQRLFSSLHLCVLTDFEFRKNGEVLNRLTGRRTCILHGNSGDGGRLIAGMTGLVLPQPSNGG